MMIPKQGLTYNDYAKVLQYCVEFLLPSVLTDRGDTPILFFLHNPCRQ